MTYSVKAVSTKAHEKKKTSHGPIQNVSVNVNTKSRNELAVMPKVRF